MREKSSDMYDHHDDDGCLHPEILSAHYCGGYIYIWGIYISCNTPPVMRVIHWYPYNSDIEPKARKWVGPKVVHDPWHRTKNYPPTPGESENQIRFYPGVPPLAISLPLLREIPNWGPFPAKFKEKMPKKDEASSHAGCTHGLEIRMKKMKIPQENAKIKMIFRRRSILGDFAPKLPKLAFSP